MTFIHIRSTKFPVLPGEADELVNPGMYGKALCQYLQNNLEKSGYKDAVFFCEDWGWLVEVKGFPVPLGVCIYAHPEQDNATDYVCCDNSLSDKKWSWKKFGFIDTRPFVQKLNQDVLAIFTQDLDVEVVQITDDMPF